MLELITIILPRKKADDFEKFKIALIRLLKDGGGNTRCGTVLQEVFGINPKEITSTNQPEVSTADTISAESQEFSFFIVNFRKVLEKGSKKICAERLKDLADIMCMLRNKESNEYLLDKSNRDKLSSADLTFSKLFKCLQNSMPCIISSGDVSILHLIIRYLERSTSSSKVVEALKKLLKDYEEKCAIRFVTKEPLISGENGSIKASVRNAQSTNPKLKDSAKKAFSRVLNFRGSGTGSVVLYWEFPKEYFKHIFESFNNVFKSKPDLLQFKITKVDLSADVPYQICLEMDIIDRNLYRLSQQQHFVADDITSEQEKFVFLLIKINRMVGECASKFLSSEEISKFDSRFEGSSFLEMVNELVSDNKLSCYDISYIQFFLQSLYNWDLTCGGNNTTQLSELLRDTQEYKPVAASSQLPLLILPTEPHPFTITTYVSGIIFISYEVMMSLKFAFSFLFHSNVSCFHYVRWKESSNKCVIVWHTTSKHFYEIESALQYNLTAGFLRVMKHPEVRFHNISISCSVDNFQMLIDGSPLLLPPIEGL